MIKSQNTHNIIVAVKGYEKKCIDIWLKYTQKESLSPDWYDKNLTYIDALDTHSVSHTYNASLLKSKVLVS